MQNFPQERLMQQDATGLVVLEIFSGTLTFWTPQSQGGLVQIRFSFSIGSFAAWYNDDIWTLGLSGPPDVTSTSCPAFLKISWMINSGHKDCIGAFATEMHLTSWDLIWIYCNQPLSTTLSANSIQTWIFLHPCESLLKLNNYDMFPSKHFMDTLCPSVRNPSTPHIQV